MNETIRNIKSHTSIRKFNNIAVTEDQIRSVLECALRGPSAGNMMAYSVIKIRSKEVLKKLADSCDDQPFIGDASVGLLFVVDSNKWHHLFKYRGISERFKAYEGPTISDFVLAMQDTMIAAQNAVVAAESLGIGTCYIGDIMENIEFHRTLFNLPDYVMPGTLVVMGNYDQQPQLRKRFEADCVVFDEKYPEIDEAFINKMFASEELNNATFAEKFYKRKMDAPFFKEMERSIKLYLEMWR